MDATTSRPAIGRRHKRALSGMPAIAAGALALVLGAALAPAAVRAQDDPAPGPGITTIGYGAASAPAEAATLQIVLTTEEYDRPRRSRADPDATPGAEEREAVAPAVEALVAAGVAEEDIEVVVIPVVDEYYGPFGPGLARLDVRVDQPTTERIQELLNAALLGAEEEDLYPGQVGVGYEVADCTPLERQAREAAIDDARRRAEIQADLLGVELGDPIGSTDRPIEPAPGFSEFYGPIVVTESGCMPPIPSAPVGSPVTVPPFDPTGEAEVEVAVQVALTFAIADSAS